MNSHLNKDPYFYIIMFEELDLYYAGIRYANKLPAKFDLLKKYFTSSERVNELIKDGNIPTIIHIEHYTDIDELIDFERRFNHLIKHNEKWINKSSVPGGRNNANTL